MKETERKMQRKEEIKKNATERKRKIMKLKATE